MSNKLGAMLGIFMMFICFLFGADLVSIQYNYTSMDALSTSISYDISRNGYLTSTLKSKYKDNYGLNVYPIDTNIDDQTYEEGTNYGYILEKDYSPIVISNGTIKLRIKRFAVINIYQ